MRLFGHLSHASLLGTLFCLVPLVTGAWYAFRPSERVLALMRPLTLGAIFAAICTFVLVLANGCVDISVMNRLDPQGIREVATILSERLSLVLASFASLSVAWFFVAIGMRRS
ncbi:MAG TPA: hypothetical protein VMU05_20820 [Dongiaceae bacterium]|nr:hypothetical protein [Dongiaceae bacterium]